MADRRVHHDGLAASDLYAQIIAEIAGDLALELDAQTAGAAGKSFIAARAFRRIDIGRVIVQPAADAKAPAVGV